MCATYDCIVVTWFSSQWQPHPKISKEHKRTDQQLIEGKLSHHNVMLNPTKFQCKYYRVFSTVMCIYNLRFETRITV